MLAENDFRLGLLTAEGTLFDEGATHKRLVSFLDESWNATWELVAKYREIQSSLK